MFLEAMGASPRSRAASSSSAHLEVSQSLFEHRDVFALASSCGSDHHQAVPDAYHFVQLDWLSQEDRNLKDNRQDEGIDTSFTNIIEYFSRLCRLSRVHAQVYILGVIVSHTNN